MHTSSLRGGLRWTPAAPRVPPPASAWSPNRWSAQFVNKIQQTRKELDFEVTDRIKIQYACDGVLKNAIDKHLDYIKTETLTDEMGLVSSSDSSSYTEWLINEEKCFINVDKSSS